MCPSFRFLQEAAQTREIVEVGGRGSPAVPAGRGWKTIRVLQIGGWSKLTAFRRSFWQ